MNNEETRSREEVLKSERMRRALKERTARRHAAFVVGEVDRFNDAILAAEVSGNGKELKGIVSSLLKECAIHKCFCLGCRFKDVCSSMCVDGVNVRDHIDAAKRKVIQKYSHALDSVEYSKRMVSVMQSRYDEVVSGDLAAAKGDLENEERDLAKCKRDLENAKKAYEAVCAEVGVSVDGKGSEEARHE